MIGLNWAAFPLYVIAAGAGMSKVAFLHTCLAPLLGWLGQPGLGGRGGLIRHLSLHSVSSRYLTIFCGGSGLPELYKRLRPKAQVHIKNDCIALTGVSHKAKPKDSVKGSHTGHEF